MKFDELYKKVIDSCREFEERQVPIRLDFKIEDLRDAFVESNDTIEKLKQKLESVQASMYCDVVDANIEVRRLKRALYIVLARSFCCMRELAARNALYDDECKWDNFKTTCLKKAEEYR